MTKLQSSELQISGMPDLRSVDWAQPQPCSNHGRGCEYMAKNQGCLDCHVSRQCKFRADGRPPSTSTNSGGRRDYLVTKGKPWTGFDATLDYCTPSLAIHKQLQETQVRIPEIIGSGSRWVCDQCAALICAGYCPADDINAARVCGWRVVGM